MPAACDRALFPDALSGLPPLPLMLFGLPTLAFTCPLKYLPLGPPGVLSKSNCEVDIDVDAQESIDEVRGLCFP